MSRKNTIPAYTLHRGTGQARVRIDGRDHYYLGRYESPESRHRYKELVDKWRFEKGAKESPDLTIAQRSVL